jgi:D-glycero-D-manno-heptose 1,7-bisphosphate phosphatase
MSKVLALDLDGETFINKPDDQKLITGVVVALERYQDWEIVGITNQRGVKLEFKSLEDCVKEQKRTMALIPRMSLLLFCANGGESFYRLTRLKSRDYRISEYPTENKNPHIWGNFRKPSPGMLNFAYYYFSREGAEDFLYVGEREESWEAAKNAGLPFMWAHTWRL